MTTPIKSVSPFMKILVGTAHVLAAGCASSTPAPAAPPGATETQSAPSQPALSIDGPSVRMVEFPASASGDQPREVKILVYESALKLVTIVLRQGTVLPEHHSEVPVTIQALQGAATVDAGGQQLRIDATHAVVLAAKVPHAVRPDPGTDVVLLVSHLGRATHQHAASH